MKRTGITDWMVRKVRDCTREIITGEDFLDELPEEWRTNEKKADVTALNNSLYRIFKDKLLPLQRRTPHIYVKLKPAPKAPTGHWQQFSLKGTIVDTVIKGGKIYMTFEVQDLERINE